MLSSLRPKQELDIPDSFVVVKHDFFAYDPTSEFNEIESLLYLNEDLFQARFDESELIIDLGWYGDVRKNKGHFELKLIQCNHWDDPVSTIHAKSLEEATEILNRTLAAIHGGVFNN